MSRTKKQKRSSVSRFFNVFSDLSVILSMERFRDPKPTLSNGAICANARFQEFATYFGTTPQE